MAKDKNNPKVQKLVKAAAAAPAEKAPIQGKSSFKVRPLGQSTVMTQRRRRRLNTKFIIGMAVWVIALAISLYFFNR